MSHIVWDDELDTLEIGEGETVQIKRRMSFGEVDRLQSFFMKTAKALMGAEPDIEGTGDLLLLHLNIKGWNLKGQDGQPLPLTKENIARLDRVTGKLIIEAITERNPAPKA